MRVLQLSTHTTLVPRHGGKLRSHHIGRILEQEGFALRRLAFCHRVPDDLDDPREPIIDVSAAPFWSCQTFLGYGAWRDDLGDFLGTGAALESPAMLAAFDAQVAAAAPDVVLLEHPWTWPLLARLPAVQSGAIRVVYSSHNVETALKQRILADAGLAVPPEIVAGVQALEQDLVAHAAGVVACTEADAAVFRSWNARRVVVAANGGVRRDRAHLHGILPDPLTPEQPYALVVGSNHPPNISGFMELVAPVLPLLPPGCRIAIAGGAGPGVIAAMTAAGTVMLAPGRLEVLGLVDEFCLDCLIQNSRVILLPIQYGGGSNVKSAEALLSGRPVIASTIAMRGFETFRGAPGLVMAEDPAGFGRALLAALTAPHEQPGIDDAALAPLLWDSTIPPLAALLREVGTAPPD